MAKDNVPFHTIVFPATLFGSGEPWKLPDFIKGFNWLTYYGGKFSTSQHRGVFMSDALELLPADYWRYYLLANAPESDDADFTWELFASTINKDLVGVFGNFVNRTVKLAASRFGGRVPAGGEAGALEQRLYAELNERVGALQRHLDDRSFRKALQELRALWTAGNGYLAEAEPWKNVPARAAVAMRVSLNLVRLFAVLAEPVMPETSRTILDGLGVAADRRGWPADPVESELTVLEPDRTIGDLPPLFRRILPEEIAALTARFGGAN
jgi:methionyl-tRNA synthetase